MIAEQLYYVVSVMHTKRADPYLTLWNPDDAGYCHRLCVAGKYPASRIASKLDYYHSGNANIAVKCEVLEAMATQSKDGYLDTPGLCAPNSSGMWFDILYAPTWLMANKPWPQYKGSRREPGRMAA